MSVPHDTPQSASGTDDSVSTRPVAVIVPLTFKELVKPPPGCDEPLTLFPSVGHLPEQMKVAFYDAVAYMQHGSKERVFQFAILKLLHLGCARYLDNTAYLYIDRDRATLRDIKVQDGTLWGESRCWREVNEWLSRSKELLKNKNTLDTESVSMGGSKTSKDGSKGKRKRETKSVSSEPIDGLYTPDYFGVAVTMPIATLPPSQVTSSRSIPSGEILQRMTGSDEGVAPWLPRRGHSAQQKQLPPGQTLCVCVGEGKENNPPTGLSQQSYYLLGAYELCGTWSGFWNNGSRFGRVVAFNRDVLVFETIDESKQGTCISAKDLYKQRDTCANCLAHDLVKDNKPDHTSWLKLWNCVYGSFQLVKNMRVDQPLHRLAAPTGPSWVRMKAFLDNHNELGGQSSSVMPRSSPEEEDWLKHSMVVDYSEAEGRLLVARKAREKIIGRARRMGVYDGSRSNRGHDLGDGGSGAGRNAAGSGGRGGSGAGDNIGGGGVDLGGDTSGRSGCRDSTLDVTDPTLSLTADDRDNNNDNDNDDADDNGKEDDNDNDNDDDDDDDSLSDLDSSERHWKMVTKIALTNINNGLRYLLVSPETMDSLLSEGYGVDVSGTVESGVADSIPSGGIGSGALEGDAKIATLEMHHPAGKNEGRSIG